MEPYQRVALAGQLIGALLRHCGNALLEATESATRFAEGDDRELIEEVASAGQELCVIGTRLEERASAQLQASQGQTSAAKPQIPDGG